MRARGMTFAQRREYRRMMRLLRQLDRADAGRSPRAPTVKRFALKVMAAALGSVLVAVFSLFIAHKLWGVTLTGQGLRLAQPLGQAPKVPQGAGTFDFLQTQPNDPARPVAYDPCRMIEYEVNFGLAPPGAAALLKDAVAKISRATGLRFQFTGTTERLPGTEEAASLRASRDPVLIVWTRPQVVPQLEGRIAGIGGSTPRRHEFSGDLEYVTGTVALDSPALHEVMVRSDGPAQVRAIMIHELGHLVGLGHVDDPTELMYDDNAGRLDLGPGDREGLALLGSGPCYH